MHQFQTFTQALCFRTSSPLWPTYDKQSMVVTPSGMNKLNSPIVDDPTLLNSATHARCLMERDASWRGMECHMCLLTA